MFFLFFYFLDTCFLQVINTNIAVRDSTGKEVESQLIPLLNASATIRNYHVKAYLGKSLGDTPSYWLAFSATVPPLGFSTYVISSATRKGWLCEFFTVWYWRNISEPDLTFTDGSDIVFPPYKCSYYFRGTDSVQVRSRSKWYNRSWARQLETYLFWKWWTTY